ncbi:dipeptide ABC transporter ATP-binding protein [Paenochrobactrum sp. BZR 588]|uniref:dipeptide ABC transporter ATP-binding protein n=1 Tax=unclassified Paenochrobactrum TaxID=2639760 RepID=UPI0038528FBF
MSELLLKIQDFSLNIGTFDGSLPILKNINLDVYRGDTLGIVGESGSGKTVLMRTVLGIGPKRSEVKNGSMRFDNIDLIGLDNRGWRKIRGTRISMIFQDPMTYLNPLFTVGQQIGDVMRAHEKAAGGTQSSKQQRKDTTLELLAQVGIPEPERVFNSYPHQLSGGMRQRILIAMALCGKPDLLIADEPTTALDVTVQAQVLDLVNELVKKLNLTVIMISHDMGAIATVAKRCAVMYKGEIVEQGLTNDILTNPQDDYTKRLLAAMPDINNPITTTVTTAETDAKPLLQVSNLKKIYKLKDGGEFAAVGGVSIHANKGEIVGIVGESGSGKSTLARLILRLVEPTSGDVFFDDKNICQLGQEDMRLMRRHMQLVFQNPHSALNGRHNIADAIGEPLRLQSKLKRHEIETQVDRLLDIVQLPRNFKYRYPHELSGGQKQRICIARAVALNPKLLILDEPTSALDVSVQAQVLEFLQELRRELDLTYLFISHDLAVIKEICNRVIVMRRGKIVEQGTVENIFSNPQQQYTRDLIESGRKTSRAALGM